MIDKPLPLDQFADLQQQPELIPIDFAPEAPELDDPLTILLRKERDGEFLFHMEDSPYYNLF